MALWKKGVRELSAGYRYGELDPVDVLAETHARIDAVNPVLNAIIAEDREAAEEAAKASSARWKGGVALGPLDGVPITIKDNIHVRGLPCTWGSRLYADFHPEADETPVERLRAGGAIILGKTNAPEFTLQGHTDNLLFGPTGNPWDPDLTPGGSSGGAVASVASGMGVVAIGTDGGGSIRRPSAHTGLVGLKPSPGFVGRSGGFPPLLLDFETLGPMARSVGDLRAALSVMAQPDPRDRASLGFGGRGDIAEFRPPQKTKILYVRQFGDTPVDPEIAASVDAAAEMLAKAGCRVVEGNVPFDVEELNAIWGLIGPVGLAWLLRQHPDARSKVNENLLPLAETGEGASAVLYFEMVSQVAALRNTLANVFLERDFIMTPSVSALPWPKAETHPATIADQPVGPRGHAVFTPFANAGGLPGINIPCTPSKAGLPIGFQLVGRYGSDIRLLDMAEKCESLSPAWQWPEL
ncbi:amidase [Oceanibium sediminis]|uniref:amidase n=1 Tax=Oceanibium sediminis TaxID=2026339 RepID=UPI000DD30010|nr:amidase [Oceanibium sediminis]